MTHQLPAVPDCYKNYLLMSEGMSLMGALHKSLEDLSEKLEERLNAIGDAVYAPGKWTMPVMLQHIIDTERIMAYRALRFARKDKTGLPGFDENDYANETIHTTRSINILIEELKLVRISNIYMFDSFSDDQLLQEGPANNVSISVAALGYIIAGHQAHHLRIIAERYLPLAKGLITPF